MRFKVHSTSGHKRYKDRPVKDFHSLESLMRFVSENGDIIISAPDRSKTPCHKPETLPTIEIYDTWRE